MTTQTQSNNGSQHSADSQQKIQELRELFADAPEVGRKALENVLKELTSQVSEPPPPIESAGRVGARLGKRSELTIIVPLVPVGAKRLRTFLQSLGGNLSPGATKVGTLHDMRFVFLDNDTKMLFATSFDGDWDTYIDDFVALKLVGRWRSGAPLTLAPNVDDPGLGKDPQRNNDFNYSNDSRGQRVPLGCHIRRMNPRDSKLTRLTDVNLHRLIRRGTTYGPPYDSNALSEHDDEVPRGAYFLFISAKAMATIEFLQQEWVNDGNFMELGRERDPVIGLQDEAATFTIPQDPVRRRIHGIETFNVLRGGEYLFMPSLSALRMLGELT